MEELEEKNKEPGNQKPKKSKSKEYFDALLFAVLVAILLKIFFIEAYRIPTGSMENTLRIGDFLLVNKFIYGATTPRNIPFTDIRIPFLKLPGFRSPHKGDVVVFDFPGNRDDVKSPEIIYYIKRLIGEPGDTVQIINKVVYVNRQIFPNPPDALFDTRVYNSNISEPRIFPKGSGWNEDNYGPIRIPADGDVIKLSNENIDVWKMFIIREGHDVTISAGNQILIDGKPSVEYTVQQDYYFMMGDNRNNSLDSRFWGFMPRDHVVGEALIIYWSWDPGISFGEFGRLLGSVRWDRVGKIVR